jgi:hypothetical protein
MSQPTKLPMIESNTYQEIGVMVGFMAIFVIVIISFAVVWRSKNKRQAQKEEMRRRELNEKGFGISGGGLKGGPGGREKGKVAGAYNDGEIEQREQI